MLNFIVLVFTFLFLFFFDRLISLLFAPFYILSLIPIVCLLFLLFNRSTTAFAWGIIYGVLKEIGHTPYIGVTSVSICIAIMAVTVLRKTLFVHEGLGSTFASGIIFFSIYFIQSFIFSFYFSIELFQEWVVFVLVNTIISFVVYFFIKMIQTQLHKRFIIDHET